MGAMTAANNLAAALAKTANKLACALGNSNFFTQRHEGTEKSDYLCASVPPCGDINPADICAQIIAYGMFAAWLRRTAIDKIPKSHPVLRELFDYVANPDADGQVRSILDELNGVLQCADREAVLKKYDETGDAVTHFYEHFLAAYNPDQRKSRGAFFTPLPAVMYIVRAVDEILRQAFHIQDGIADKSVSILDPATGTGTFLIGAVAQIFGRIAGQYGQKGWHKYAANDLLPRLHGIEIMPSSYLIAHLELGTLLQDMGGSLEENQRLSIQLANALDFASLRLEFAAKTQGMQSTTVVLGNPPYNVSTANREHGKDLIAQYKEGLKHETNIQPLSDDYIKFIALGQHLIEANQSDGILAYISNNSFLDGVIHWKMRKSLLETFDKIYVLNLHGNTRKKEVDPNGSKDGNIFRIKQGVSINIFVCNSHNGMKTQRRREASPPNLCAFVPLCEEKNELGKVFYADLYGTRTEKLHYLETQTIATSHFSEFTPAAPDYFFVPKDFSLKAEYDEGFGVNQLFIKQGTGIKFRKDNLFVKNHFARNDVVTMLRDMEQLDDRQLLEKYNITETHDWQLADKRQYFLNDRPEDIVPVLYRVFDMRWTYYPMDKISNIIVRSDARKGLMQHLFRENLVLLTLRNQPTVQEFDRVFIAKGIIEHCVIGRGTYAFPLYYYESNGTKHLNLNEEIVGKIFSYTGTKAQRTETSDPVPLCLRVKQNEDIFDYVYGVLHDSQYRARYQEFLKIDFPRIPYPKDAAMFEQYVRDGVRLRKLHLLEEVPELHSTFPIAGNNVIKNVRHADGKVFINETQYFENVPDSVWNFFIGGSCPARKYLKDRKGRVLSEEEMLHYQKIVAVLSVSARFSGFTG